jgi:hypothetical protein
MNSSLDPAWIEEQIALDPIGNDSEFNAVFRNDVDGFLRQEYSRPSLFAAVTSLPQSTAANISVSQTHRAAFSDAQFELLLEQLGEMDEARLVMRLALYAQWQKANARTDLNRSLDRGART